MKIIKKYILPFQENLFFSPLRDKIDYAKLIVYSARSLLINDESCEANDNIYMKLIVNKMSRILFSKENKYFSVSFPFNIQLEEDHVTDITTYSGLIVNSHTISDVISIVKDEKFELYPSPIHFYIESESLELTSFLLLEEILHFEPSYVRYDVDPLREDVKYHPLHHLDINYSQYGTYKLGLSCKITEKYFENLIDINEECKYLKI